MDDIYFPRSEFSLLNKDVLPVKTFLPLFLSSSANMPKRKIITIFHFSYLSVGRHC